MQRSVDRDIYRKRNLVERFFNKLKHFRRIATRFDKLARNFLATVLLASTRLWIRAYESTTDPELGSVLIVLYPDCGVEGRFNFRHHLKNIVSAN